jgi:hypothetical protein
MGEVCSVHGKMRSEYNILIGSYIEKYIFATWDIRGIKSN